MTRMHPPSTVLPFMTPADRLSSRVPAAPACTCDPSGRQEAASDVPHRGLPALCPSSRRGRDEPVALLDDVLLQRYCTRLIVQQDIGAVDPLHPGHEAI